MTCRRQIMSLEIVILCAVLTQVAVCTQTEVCSCEDAPVCQNNWWSCKSSSPRLCYPVLDCAPDYPCGARRVVYRRDPTCSKNTCTQPCSSTYPSTSSCASPCSGYPSYPTYPSCPSCSTPCDNYNPYANYNPCYNNYSPYYNNYCNQNYGQPPMYPQNCYPPNYPGCRKPKKKVRYSVVETMEYPEPMPFPQPMCCQRGPKEICKVVPEYCLDKFLKEYNLSEGEYRLCPCPRWKIPKYYCVKFCKCGKCKKKKKKDKDKDKKKDCDDCEKRKDCDTCDKKN